MKSWVSSPLAINYVLSLYKNGSSYQKKYLQIYKDLKMKQVYLTSNLLLLSQTSSTENQYDTSDSIEKKEFGTIQDARQYIMKWINQYGSFTGLNVEKHVLPNTSLLCNISVFKNVWKCNQSSPVMRVHNSFSYTEDIKYEARLIELPMQDADFKLVIIVPNEVGSVSRLFTALAKGGLRCAVGCVQPLFTFSSVLEAPSVEFRSEQDVYFTERNCEALTVVQIGSVQINNNGTIISILTLLSSTHKTMTSVIRSEDSVHLLENEAPYYFAVLFKDTAVFTGRYVKRV